MGKKSKKDRKDEDEDWMEELEALKQEQSGAKPAAAEEAAPQPKGGKNNKKGGKKDEEELAGALSSLKVEDEDDDKPKKKQAGKKQEAPQQKGGKNTKGKKDESSEESESEEESEEEDKKKSAAKGKKEPAKPAPAPAKKGGKKKDESEESEESESESESESEDDKKKKNKGKDAGKKEPAKKDTKAAPAPAKKGGKKKDESEESESESESEEEEEEEDKKDKKGSKGGKADAKGAKGSKKKDESEEESEESESGSEDEDDGKQQAGKGTVKTAAQKKAEKKEKEKQKKLAAKQRQKEQKQKEQDELDRLLKSQGLSPQPSAEAAKKDAPKEAPKPAQQQQQEAPKEAPKDAPKAEESGEEEDDAAAGEENKEGGESAASKKKKKKKKGKGDAEKKEEEKAAPAKNSKLGALLKAQMEERERKEAELRKIEEEKRRILEEKLRAEEEAIRLEEERKARKKQKEAERKERLKAEGKLLTKAEKERLQNDKAKLEQMLADGIEVPALAAGEPKKKVVYGKRKKGGAAKDSQDGSEAATPGPDGPEDDGTAADNGAEAATEETATTAAPAAPAPATATTGGAPALLDNWEDALQDDWEALAVDDSKKEAAPAPAAAPASAPAAAAAKEAPKAEEKKAAAKEAPKEDKGKGKAKDESAPAAAAPAVAAPAPAPVHAAPRGPPVAATPEEIKARIEERRKTAEANRSTEVLRAPICAVLGHVDTGKTKIQDRIRRSNVQEGEAGGITQQIGATNIPQEELLKQIKPVRKAQRMQMKIPGLLLIDTPGHESFSNLRSRGSSLCDIAVLVVDIMHGIEPQTAESIEMLRSKKVPFIIALNKVDRLNEWRSTPNAAIQDSLNDKKQKPNTMQDFETRFELVKLQFAEKGLNTALYWDNPDERTYINIVPTSAITGEGIPDLLYLLCHLTQKRLAQRIALSEDPEATVMEVKEVKGYGMTIDVILANGTLHEGDTVVLTGMEGPIVTTIRSLLLPAPMKELRVKNSYNVHKEVRAAQGVKIAAKDLDKTIAGLPMYIAQNEDEVPFFSQQAEEHLKSALNAIKTKESGVCVQASTLGSLEALMAFLKAQKIDVSSVNIGPIHKRDITTCSIQLERDRKFAVILAFDVPIDKDAQAMADNLGVKIFSADIIYHLENMFTKYLEDLKNELREKNKYIATFPCRLQILPNCIFNARDPIIIGVKVVAGQVKVGTPICVPAKEKILLGRISGIEFDHKAIEIGKEGQDVCIKIEAGDGDKKLFGRHFDDKDELVSLISRESIDACKEYFRDDLSKSDWKLIMDLKKTFDIL